jgi:hypothetical protein
MEWRGFFVVELLHYRVTKRLAYSYYRFIGGER